MSYIPINLAQKLALFDEHWRPKVIAEMNDYQFKLVKLRDEFVWHQHDDTDEVFFVVDGTMTIAMRGNDGVGDVTLRAGELFVVPKGVEHKPFAAEECSVLLIEPRGVVNTGDASRDAAGALRAPEDVWV